MFGSNYRVFIVVVLVSVLLIVYCSYMGLFYVSSFIVLLYSDFNVGYFNGFRFMYLFNWV